MKLRAVFLPFLLLSAACAAAAPAAAPSSSPPAVVADRAAQNAASPSEADAAVPIHGHNPSWGSRTALVTIVEFSDFQCPFCQRVQPTLSRIRETYGPQTVRLVWKNNPLPFHDQARPVAEAAMGVFALGGTDAFWRFHDLVFANQGALGADASERWARESGVANIEAWRAGVAARTWSAAVDADLTEGGALGVEGTPSFFINGVSLVGAQPFEAFQAIIDDQVRAARAKLAAGIAPDRVYAALASENRASTPKAQPEEEPEPEDSTVFRIPVGNSPVLGSPSALVTIVEFSDFQCPYCSRVEATLKGIRDKYGDKVRLVWKNNPLPFHPWAEPAAEAALEVRAEKGNAAFWRVHDAIFANQKALEQSVLVRLAVEAGARADAVKKAIETHSHARDIEADTDLADDFQADGTPHFFINGRRLVGAQPEEKFDAVIDDEMKKAQDLLAKGTRADGVYDALVKDGKGAPPPETKQLARSLPPGDPARGNQNARVTIHEWSDFQCPFCLRVEPTLARLLKEYDGRVRLIWHDLPLPMHPDAPLAARAAREAYKQKGQRAFWQMHDKLFGDQSNLRRDALDGYARELMLDMDRWNAVLVGAEKTGVLDGDRQAAEDMGISGTPSFVVVPGHASAGYFLSGAQSYAKFRRLVDRALAEAK